MLADGGSTVLFAAKGTAAAYARSKVYRVMALAVVGFGEPQALPLGHPARDCGPRVHEVTLGGIDCCFYRLRHYAIGADHLRVGRGRASAS